MVTFKEEWSKLYYTQHTLLSLVCVFVSHKKKKKTIDYDYEFRLHLV